MIELKAVADTYLKKSTDQAIDLPESDKKLIVEGNSINVKSRINAQKDCGDQIRVTLTNNSKWYIYLPHWELINLESTEDPVEAPVVEKKDNLPTFSNGVPKPVIKENPTKTEVIEAIVNYCLRVGVTNRQQIAYVLSTAEGESNFKPVREYRGAKLTADQKRYWNTGYMGRGFIQVTWEDNYRRVGKELGVDLLGNPKLLLTYPVAIASLVLGMRDGWYTGKKLSDYLPGNSANDYNQARNIVNPGEIKFSQYAARAKKFVDNSYKWAGYLNKFAEMYEGIA